MSDLKVVRLDANAGRREEVIGRAKMLLTMAEEGKIVDLSYAASKPDGSMISGFTATDDAPRRLSGVSMLQFRLLRIMEDQSEPG